MITPTQPPKDVLKHQVSADDEVTAKKSQFLRTPAGVNLQAQLHSGVLDEVAYRARFNQLFDEFLQELHRNEQAA